MEGPQTSRSISFYYVRPTKCVTKEASNCHTNLIIYLFTLLQYILELTIIYNIYTHGQAILPRIRTFAAKPDHFQSTFIKKVRNRIKVRKIGPKWRDWEFDVLSGKWKNLRTNMWSPSIIRHGWAGAFPNGGHARGGETWPLEEYDEIVRKIQNKEDTVTNLMKNHGIPRGTLCRQL